MSMPNPYYVQRSMLPLGSNRYEKYGYSHSWDCTCQKCMDWMELHERHFGTVCHCDSCRVTRQRLDLIRETEENGRRYGPREEIPMATINICDRPGCGALVKSDAMGNVEFFTGGGDGGERVRGHLCPACVGDLVTLWETEPTDRDKSYGKAWERPKRLQLEDMTSAELIQLAISRGREELNEQ